MDAPHIELIPLKPATCVDAAVTLDVLVRVTPPRPEVHVARPPINLALVLDRSGSMGSGKKMQFARKAAAFAVEQLLPSDRVSVTIYDNTVETIVPNTAASDKAAVLRAIEGVAPRGATDLHGGWAEGAGQAERNLVAGGLNRVLLLSDGLANAGVTDPNAIAAEAKGRAARGVSTTTLGVGADYNEDLMEAMARAGDGNYYYIDDPVQLTDIFQTELHGLMATLGQKVSLGVEPEGGVTVSDVLNDYEKAPTGRHKLPNLVVGLPILAVVRLNVPPQGGQAPLCGFRLAWDDPKTGRRLAQRVTLDDLPAVPQADWDALTTDSAVQEQVALLMSARAQKEAGRALDRGDVAGSHGYLQMAVGYTAAAPRSAATSDELDVLKQMLGQLDAGDEAGTRKMAKYRAYQRHTSKGPPPAPPGPPAPPPPPSA